MLLLSVIQHDGIHTRADWWSLIDLVLQLPTLAVLLWYITCNHPQPFFMRWFSYWLWFVALLYGLGIAADIWDLTTEKTTASRFGYLFLDLASLGLLANLLYLLTLLKQRHPGSVTVEEPSENTLLTTGGKNG